ncbi:MAG: NAD(P)-dependent oxidoreductase [Rhodospirillales bacterium]|nr:NAD(P)-dependent oxidoreductase [Rhodospirillales bacterium]
MKTAFIGLGVMGYPMAGHLVKGGHEVTVYNRTTAKAKKWADEHGGSYAETPAEAAKGADVVCMCVGNDDDLRSVTYGDMGVLAGMGEGTLLIDHTTASAEVARKISTAAKEKGIGFIDAPVSGGQAGAENGVLTIMIGGEQTDYDRSIPVIDCYARKHQLLGDCGSGQLAKMVNQICIAGLVQGLAEGIAFGTKAGLDMRETIAVLAEGAAGSWQMVNRHETMIDDHFEHGFAVDWMRKDLGIAMSEAKNNGALLPVTALVDQFYSEVQNNGGGRWDTSSLLTRLK